MRKAILIFLCSVVEIYASDHFLSFIIPCYNCEQWIGQAVNSIYQQQLFCPFEIVCTDDGSTDRTYEILCELQIQHPEMRINQHSMNQGGSVARNTCVQSSRGDIIFCLDADNVLMPNSVETLIQCMDQTGADAVSFGGLYYFRGDFEIDHGITYDHLPQFYDLRAIFSCRSADNPIWSGNYLYTRESFDRVGGYPAGNVIDTFAFGFLQLLKGCKMCYVPNTNYFHRVSVQGYFEREAYSGRLHIHFCQLLLDHAELFTEDSVQLLKDYMQRVINKQPYDDFIAHMTNNRINLK